MTCSYAYTGSDYEYNSEVEFKVKDNIVVSATATMTYQDEKKAKNMCEIFKISSDVSEDLVCDDNIIKVNNYHKSVSQNDITKDQFVKYLEEQKFDCE